MGEHFVGHYGKANITDGEGIHGDLQRALATVFLNGCVLFQSQLYLASGNGGGVGQSKAGVLTQLDAVIHIVQSAVLIGDAALGVDVAGGAGEISKVAIGIFLHIAAHGGDNIRRKIQPGLTAGHMGVRLPVGKHHVLAAFTDDAQHLKLGIGFANMTCIGLSLGIAEVIAADRAIAEGIMTDGIQTLCLHRAGI